MTRPFSNSQQYAISQQQVDQDIQESLTATPITFEQYNQVVKKMHRLEDQYDTETAHMKADKLISSFVRELGYDELADAFDDIEKWYA
jgi:DNA replication protein DnaD